MGNRARHDLDGVHREDMMAHWNWGNIAVNLGIGVDVMAAIGYGLQGDWKRVLYWISATGIMVAVRLM